MMSKVHRMYAALLITGAALLLSGCAPEIGDNVPAVGATDNPEYGRLHWFNTQVGAVQCLRAPSASGYYTSSCNWQALRPNHTVKNRPTLDGHWVTSKLGTMYCLRNPTRAGYHQYDCDWAHVTKKTTSQ